MRHLLLSLLLLLIMQPVFAVRVPTIYQVSLPVTTQSPEEKDKAAAQGLSQVLIKVSGNPDVMDNPSLKFQLSNASRFIQEFNYTPGKRTPFLLKLKFDEEAVNQILHNADIPILGINRPLILAWVVFQVAEKQPEIIDNSSLSDIKGSLVSHAEKRGIPVIFPVMDMDDINKVSVNDIINMHKDSLVKASARYNSEAVLIARIYPQPMGFFAEAKLVSGNDEWNWKLSDKSAQDVLDKLVDNVADTISSHAASMNKNSIQEQVTLKVSGITERSDYDLLVKYLKDLTPVASVELVKMAGNIATLTVNLRGTEQSLVQALEVGDKLSPVQSNDLSIKALFYEWKR